MDPLLVNFYYRLLVFLTAKRVPSRSGKRFIATSIATRIHSRPKLPWEDKSISIIARDTRSSIVRLVGRSLSRVYTRGHFLLFCLPGVFLFFFFSFDPSMLTVLPNILSHPLYRVLDFRADFRVYRCNVKKEILCAVDRKYF